MRFWFRPYDPESDKRPYSALSRSQRIARERASYRRQLDAVDRELQWIGTGSGRIEAIRHLKTRLGSFEGKALHHIDGDVPNNDLANIKVVDIQEHR